MIRVALISEHASPLAWLGGADSGGQNVYVGQVARGLARRGHRVDVFTRRDEVQLADEVLCEDGVRVVHVPAGPPEAVRKEELLGYMDDFSAWMRDYLDQQPTYDVVHANFFMSALVASDLRRSHGVPYVVTFHALGKVRRQYQGSADEFPDERLDIEEAIVAEANRIIAECPQDLADLTELYGADRRKLTMIPCGFDPGELWPLDRALARRQLGWNQQEPIILQLGRMVPRKGVETVIRAMAALRDRYGVRARLAIVGGETREPDPVATPEIGRLQAICRELDVLDQVTFVGSRLRNELRTYFSAADVFVTTPWYEPFGITPLEAMACRAPVVGSAVGGIKMTIADGETGFLVPPRNPAALADRLSVLLANPRLREQMGLAGERRVKRLFTWDRVVAAIERTYVEVLHRTASKPPLLTSPLPLASSHIISEAVT
jgi:glycosyltransferase involved in cell wall biosynthesis